MEGVEAMQQQREGKITLRSKEVCRIMCGREAHWGSITLTETHFGGGQAS